MKRNTVYKKFNAPDMKRLENENVTDTIARNMRYLRQTAGMTQKDIADVMGLDHRTISSYEKGNLEPSVSTLIRYCEYFNVRPDELTGFNENNNISKYIWPDEEETKMLKAYRRKDEFHKKIIRGLCYGGPHYMSEEAELKMQENMLRERTQKYNEKEKKGDKDEED